MTEQVTKQADQKFCFSCGKVLHNSAKSCPTCGAMFEDQSQSLAVAEPVPVVNTIKPAHHYCVGCGGQVHDTAAACPKCGAKQASVAGPGSKSKTTAGLLAILLGGIGVHHFYLRNIGLGILYLLFCWTYIPAIIGLIEGIVILTKSDADFNQKYNK